MDHLKKLLADRKIWVLFIGLLIFKLLLLPWVEVTDSDAVSRVFTAEELINEPRLVSEGVWLPLHYYFTSLSILLSGGSLWYGPMIFHVLIGALTIFPLYRFTAREFNERGAMWAVIIYVLSPVVFRNSYHALAGVPNAFFIMMVMDFMSRLRHSGSLKDAVYAGVFMTIACGFRYESWLLFALFTGMLLLFRVSIKRIAIFWLIGMLFPAFWMIGNWIAHHDLFYGLSGAYHWNVIMEDVNAGVDLTEKIKRIVFFPLSWLLNISPLVGVTLFFVGIARHVKRKLPRTQLILVIPFLVMCVVFLYKSYEGTLLDQHRFTIALLLLSAPFLSYLAELKSRVYRTVLIMSCLGSFIFSFNAMFFEWERIVPQERVRNVFKAIRLETFATLQPIPRQTDPEIRNVMKLIEKEKNGTDGLIMDFWTWESTYCMALHSGFSQQDIFLIDGAKNSTKINEEDLDYFLKTHDKPLVLLSCSSHFRNNYSIAGNEFSLTTLNNVRKFPFDVKYSKDGMHVIAFSQTGNTEINCPQEETIDYYRMTIRRNLGWYNEIKFKAYKKSITIDEMLEKDSYLLLTISNKKALQN
ncbi:MAG: hypothetical protein EP333_04315 [Bacteroidetes bacterium]|nr:MAG: hypothetical protein EP333_04315 [Bacteroidota bacterium]